MGNQYIIWHCCGVDFEDTREDAFAHAHYLNYDSDYHRLVEFEGPDGTILTHSQEFADYEQQRIAKERERRNQTPHKPVGTIEACMPDGTWRAVDTIFHENQLGEIRYYQAALGDDRVRFIAST